MRSRGQPAVKRRFPSGEKRAVDRLGGALAGAAGQSNSTRLAPVSTSYSTRTIFGFLKPIRTLLPSGARRGGSAISASKEGRKGLPAGDQSRVFQQATHRWSHAARKVAPSRLNATLKI